MSFRVNFFPIPYILVLILLVAFVVIFNETIFSYFIASVDINGAIVGLFIFCNIWVLSSLAYFSRSAKLLSKIFAGVGPVVEKQSIKKDKNVEDKKSMVLQTTYPISGTLFDSPIFSSVLAKLDRKNKLEVSRADAEEIAQAILDNATKVLAPSKFLASIFVLMGLIGTFFGLLATIGGVARALNTLASGGLSTDISKFIKLLSDPLQGMSTAFSASLFGLTSALISNFANFSAWQKVLIFTNKVRNYLISNTGVFDEDPARVSVRDLLISLEESFDMLYRGITNKLEDLTNHIATMGSVIVKTHERQERMLRVILKDHELIEQFWKKFLLSEEGIMGVVDNIADRLSVVLPEAIRKVFAPVLENMLDIMDNNSAMLERALVLAQDGVNVQQDIANISNEAAKILNENAALLNRTNEEVMRANEELMCINSRLNLDQIASLIVTGNNIKQELVELVDSSNAMLDEANNLAKDNNEINIEGNTLKHNLIGSVDNNTGAVEEVIEALSNTNSIIVDIKAINESAHMAAEQNNALTQEVLNAQNVSNDIVRNIVDSTNTNNVIGRDTLLLLGNMFEENNNLARAILGGVSEVIQHNENMVRILDERFGMIIALSSDLLASSGAVVSLLDVLNSALINHYQSTAESLNRINGELSNLNRASVDGLALMNASVVNSDAVIQRLDGNNEIILNNLHASNEILANVSLANDTLNNLYMSTAQYFNDAISFNSLYISMEQQINALLNSFLEFKDHFANFASSSQLNGQVLANIHSLNSNMIERVHSLGTLLNEVVGVLSNLNMISAESRDINSSIKLGVENILNQNDVLNQNITTVGGIFENGISKVMDGVALLNNTSASYSQAMNSLLENIVASLTTLSELSAKASNIIDINQNSAEAVFNISKQIADAAKEQKDHKAISEEVKEILINSDGNISGIGNILNALKDTSDLSVQKLDNIIDLSAKSEEHDKILLCYKEKLEKTLNDVTALINNLGVVYEKYGEKTKESLDSISEGISSVFKVNTKVSEVIDEIKTLSQSIEQDVYGKSNNLVLSELKDKLQNMLAIKDEVLKEFEATVLPVVNNFKQSFNIVVEKITALSQIADQNKGVLEDINTKTDNVFKEQLNVVNASILNLDKSFKSLSGYVESINKMFEAHKDTIGNINEGMKDIKVLIQDFSSIPHALKDTANGMASIGAVIRSLEQVSNNMNTNFVRLTNNLSEEIKGLANIFLQLDDTFKLEASKLGQGTGEVYNNITRLIQQVSQLGGDIKAHKDADILHNENLIKEINNSFENISNSIGDIKNTLSTTIGSKLLNELNKISGNQQEISYRVEQIVPYINELIRLIEGFAELNVSKDLTKIISTLEKITDADISNNNKLELLIKAADTLVSEMLNSRNVSQAILDIIAELGGFKRVK